MRKLDRNKPFGEVHGARDGHKYEQDGIKFDNDGIEYVEPGTSYDTAEDVDVEVMQTTGNMVVLQSEPGTAPDPAATVATVQTARPAPVAVSGPYTAKHKGGGKYAVMNGEEAVATGLTKEAAELKASDLNSLESFDQGATGEPGDQVGA